MSGIINHKQAVSECTKLDSLEIKEVQFSACTFLIMLLIHMKELVFFVSGLPQLSDLQYKHQKAQKKITASASPAHEDCITFCWL